MFEFDGVEYNIGTVVSFDFGRRCLVGVITEIDPDPLGIRCTIVEPSGRKRIRTLDRDVKNGKMSQIEDAQAYYMNTSEWIKRSNRLSKRKS